MRGTNDFLNTVISTVHILLFYMVLLLTAKLITSSYLLSLCQQWNGNNDG